MAGTKQPRKVADGWRMFAAGGCAGATARTATAPLDRIKLLFQVQAVSGSRASAAANPTSQKQPYTGVLQAARKILHEEGVRAFWKGNGTNIIRIFPYSAAQLAANDQYKRLLSDAQGQLTVPARLLAGGCAGMTATALTHPLDTLRLRLALPNSGYHGIWHALRTITNTEGPLALYKGLGPTLLGVAPYAALNFSAYDLLKTWLYQGGRPQGTVSNLLLGAAAGTIASSVCYPLDTVRRRMQLRGTVYRNQLHALVTIWREEGWRGYYRGWAANTIKVVPQNAIRFVAYETLKTVLGVHKASSDT